MPQMQMPLFPVGSTDLTSHLAYQNRDGQVTYFYGHLPVFTHSVTDIQTFRLITSQFICNGIVSQAQVSRAFGIPLVTVKRYVKLYRKKGSAGFFEEPNRRGAAILTEEVLDQCQKLLDSGKSRKTVALELKIKQNTLSKAIQVGKLHEQEKKTPKASF